MYYKESASRRAYLALNYAFCVGISILCLMPILYVLAVSLSDKDAILAGKVSFWPVGFSLKAYLYIASDSQFVTAFNVSVARTVSAVALQMTLTVLAAYPLSLSRRQFSMRQFYMWAFIVTILFSGGLIPTYLVVVRTGILDTFLALILPACVPVFNIILLQNFMKALPDSISEAAFIDGAGHFRVMTRVVLPLCKPSLATLVLFVSVNVWNEYFHGMLFINDPRLFPLQTYLRTVIIEVDMAKMSDMEDIANQVASAGANAAKIFLAMFPIICVYPFVQKHFVKGIVQGSMKE